MDILVLAAHPDDEILGCGATLIKWVREWHRVSVAFAGKGRPGGSQAEDAKTVAKLGGWQIVAQGNFPDQQYDCVGVLALAQWAEGVLSLTRPSRVLIHTEQELNQDHQILSHGSRIACRGQKEIWGFEVPGSTLIDWRPNVFVEITGPEWPNKSILIRKYISECRDSPHPRSLHVLEAKARLWGSQAGCELAEAFQLVRAVA